MKTAIYTFALVWCSLVASNVASAMPVSENIAGSVTGSSGTIGVFTPIRANGNDGKLLLAGAFFRSDRDFSVAIETSPTTFQTLTAISSVFITPTFGGVSVLQKVFTLPGDILQSAVSDGFLNFLITQPELNNAGTLATRAYEGSVTYNSTPEPATMTILAIGGTWVGFGAIRRRRQAGSQVAAV